MKIRLKLDVNTTRVTAIWAFLMSVLRMKSVIVAYTVSLTIIPKELDLVHQDFIDMSIFEAVLNITRVTTTLTQYEQHVNRAYRPLQRAWMTEEEIMELPDCDGRLKESQSQFDLSLESDVGIQWFCPYFYPIQDIDVYSCRSGGCSKSRHEIGMKLTWMNECRTYLSFDNHKNRVFSCMSWEVNPDLHMSISGPLVTDNGVTNNTNNTFLDREKTDMRHLRKQIWRLKPVCQWYETNENVKDQSDRVPNWETSEDEIFFSNKTCVQVDCQVVLVKPVYKFDVVKDNNRNFCFLSSKTTLSTNLGPRPTRVKVFKRDMSDHTK